MIPTSLYEISSAMNEILLAEEWDDAAIERLEGLNLAFEAKGKGIAHVVANLTAFSNSAKEEEQRIAGKRKAAEGRIASLKSYLMAGMISADRTEVTCGTFKVSIQNNPPAVVVDEERLIPAKYWTVIPESYALNKKDLAADLKLAPVEGCHLEQGKSLRIK